MIPLCDLRRQYLSLKDEIDVAMQRVAEEGHYILGPNVKALEQELAVFAGCRYAVGVGNGTDALHLALRALEIGPGDEVITTPFTFIATTEAIGLVGAVPVFVDIDPRTFNIDPGRIEAALTARTRAILPVHLYGQACDMSPILQIARSYGLFVVEDCAQAIGAKYQGRMVGTLGDVGCLSFFPSKNLGCFGDGGAVLTNDPKTFDRVEHLRRHGGKVKYHHRELGLNSRLDELQAAILRVKLPHLNQWNELRRCVACRYNRLLANATAIQRPLERTSAGLASVLHEDREEEATPRLYTVYHQYTASLANRDEVANRLQEAGIGSAVYYPVPLHLQEVHANLGLGLGSFPHAEEAASRCLSLPMFPELTECEQQRVVDVLLGTMPQQCDRSVKAGCLLPSLRN